MKVKKIGSTEEKPQEIITEKVFEKEKPQIIVPEQVYEKEKQQFIRPEKPAAISKTKYYIIGGVLLLIILSLLYYIFIYQNQSGTLKTDNLSQDEMKSKELDLKEKELQLKEQEQQKKEAASQLQKYSMNSPEGVVVKFIESLGKRDFSSAFTLMTEKRRGSYNAFTSTKGYGGITSTKIFSCTKTGQINDKYEVMVSYESIDPANKSGKFSQYFYLIPFNDSYLISEIKNIDIQWY